jgi:signal transduction histidine kinase
MCSVVRDVTERKRSEKAMREVREAERNRMARDLHDGALQDLTYALAEAQILKLLSEDSSLNERLDQQIEALRRTERGLRSAVYDLLPAGAEDRPLPERLETLVEESRRMSPGCDIRSEVEEGFPSAPL